MLTLDPSRQLTAIKTLYTEKKSGEIVFLKTPKEVKSYKHVEEINTIWRRLTWKDETAIRSSCIDTNNRLDYTKYRDMKLKACLKRWNIKDSDGNIADVTPANIDKLPSDVVEELITAFENYTDITKEDLQKLETVAHKFFTSKELEDSDADVLPYIYEHVILKCYNWTLEYLRSIDHADFMAHLRLCMVSEVADKEFQIQSRGLGAAKKKQTPKGSHVINQKFDPTTGKFVDT